MTYLLDTNACIALINGAPVAVRRRFRRVAKRGTVLLSSIVAFELWYGVAKSNIFFGGPLDWTVFDQDDAREAGRVRSELEAAGRPIGAYDVLIAGQARRRRATLVTSNAREFGRVSGLKWEDWSAPRVR